ncbi:MULTISPECIES: fasciclin domain-containing protein [Methanoculleus]|uniref:Beta-Ig-H3/fasciclin n=2 Tax=Methanoculleus TaxID=45989 RepID=A3CWA0_METMJ|nr:MULTISPECIES: fasciclin domain-containing protein [Methanoculleus]ABN57650.1 beta-Ig-H3/fasciclin [Methanoculleus marisnigri JR1]MCC7556007.1 fasciclin domain-containing protein [Methanoculleus marisnigri]UYU19046.1 fasciclin domain-containing protein [Methanoculleus submarinus]
MKNIIDTLEDSESLSVFLDLVRIAGMEPMLRERGPYTVFVPTDEAFSRVPRDRMDEIRQDADKLLLIVSYHVVPGQLTSEDLRSIGAVRSSLGTDLVLRSSDRGITVNSVPIVETDAFCTNGICHAISAALVPPTLEIVTP